MRRLERIGLVVLLGLALWLVVNPEPLVGLRGAVWAAVDRFRGPSRPVEDPGEIRRLRRELRVVRAALLDRDEALLAAHDQLRRGNLFRNGLADSQLWRLTPARVIHISDRRSGRRIAMLSRGMQDGVQGGMAVVVGTTLVGLVDAVGPTTSQVLLVTDPQCRLRTLVRPPLGRTPSLEQGQHVAPAPRRLGVAVGTTSAITLRFVPVERAPKAGYLVLTAGRDGRVPPGLLIGRVVSVDTAAHRYLARIALTPDLDLDQLERVHILDRALAAAGPGGEVAATAR